MVLVLRLTTRDWASTRFVRSSLWEANQAARVLSQPRRQRPHRSWLGAVDHEQARARMPVLEALHPTTGWVPGFLTPQPRTDLRSVQDELEEVATTSLARVRDGLARGLASHPTRARRAVLQPLVDDPARALALIVDELAWSWRRLVEPFWEPVNALIGEDIAYRAGEAARRGLGKAIDDLDPGVSWRDGEIHVGSSGTDTVRVGRRGLALMPSAFVWPDVAVVQDPSWDVTIVYPARGIASLWAEPASPPAGLAGVLGSTRALLLTDLTASATTQTLARRHGLSPAAVSAALHRLQHAGLVDSQRVAKEVFYRRTALGGCTGRRQLPDNGKAKSP